MICKALVNKLSEGVCLFAVNRLLLVFMAAKQFHSSMRNKTKRRLRGAKSHNLRFHRNNVLTKKSVHDVGVIFGHGQFYRSEHGHEAILVSFEVARFG